MNKAMLVFLSAVTLALPAAAGAAALISENGFVVESSIDWAGGNIAVEARRDLDPGVSSLVRAKGDAETYLEARMPDLLSRVIAPLRVDSSHVYGDLLSADPQLFGHVNDIALGARPSELFLTPDLTVLVARYTVPLFGARGVALPLLPAVATPVRRWLGDVITRKYTGLLIFAKGMLPEAGTSRMLAARPALFPRIWDEQMNLVMDRSICSPQALARWGEVGYSENIDDPALDLRVGTLPLRLAARGVYGDAGTDIVISTDGARQLLALSENIALLKEGRIVIVYESLHNPTE
jgi:hypothetical protein